MMDAAWIAILVGVIYAGCLRGNFVFDDWTVILAKPDILGAKFRDVVKWKRAPAQVIYAAVIYLYNPGTVKHGARPDPLAFHAVNVAVHAVNSVLVTLVAQAMGFDAVSSLIAGLVFAVHPLATSAACYISALSTLLSAMFGFAAVILIYSAVPWLAIPCLILAFLSKEDAVVWPVPCAILAYIHDVRLWPLIVVLPLFMAFYERAMFARVRQHNGSTAMTKAGGQGAFRASTSALTFLVEHLLRYPMWCFGAGQNPDPQVHPVRWGGRRFWTAFGIALNLALVALLLPSSRIPLLLIVASPLAVYPFIPLPDVIQEHRGYFSVLGVALGFSLALGALPAWLTPVTIAGLASVAAYRAMHWHNWEDFWSWAILSGSARKTRPLQNLAAYYKLNQQPLLARSYLSAIIQVNPASAPSLCDLADIDCTAGNLDKAQQWLEQSTEKCPEYAQAWFGLARIHQYLNRPEESARCLERHAALMRG